MSDRAEIDHANARAQAALVVRSHKEKVVEAAKAFLDSTASRYDLFRAVGELRHAEQKLNALMLAGVRARRSSDALGYEHDWTPYRTPEMDRVCCRVCGQRKTSHDATQARLRSAKETTDE